MEELYKNLKAKKSLLVMGIILFVLFMGIGLLLYFDEANAEFVKLSNKTGEGVYAKVNVSLLDSAFATETVDNKKRDYYLVFDEDNNPHVIMLDNENFEKCEKFDAYDFLKKMQKEGKIKYIGFSFHGTVDDLRNIVSTHKWDFAQIQMNYLDWENQNAKMQYQILEDAGIPTIVMEPVRGGKLALVNDEISDMFKSLKPDNSPASWAMGFVASHKNIITILSGMNSAEQMHDNLSTLTDFKQFTDIEYSLCEKAAAIINKSEVISCTGCDYCQPCPKGIKISSFFSLYNSVISGEIDINLGRDKYNSYKVNPTACAWCNKCKNHCPQSISVPDVLEGKVVKLFMQ